MRATGWCFTINNYTFEEMDACINLPMDYKVFGFEVGNKGTPHIQGYLYHHNKVSMRQIKKLLSRAHIEKAKGTPQIIIIIVLKMENIMNSVIYPGRESELIWIRLSR